MGKRTALLMVLISVVVVGLFTTSQAFIASNIHTCPHSFANDTQDAFGLSNRSAYVQLGLTHRIPCLPYSQREGESPFIAWYKLNESTDISENGKEWLVSYNREEIPGNRGPRYSLAYDFGLLIKDVEESDGGKYLCEVIWRDKEYIKQEETINIQVIGHTLPHGGEAVSEASSTASLHRGRRQTLPCECASQTPDVHVVYWSTGEGVITQIIGARFSNGATLQIQHGADYSIGINASLTINSLNDLQDTQTFWCHVFLSDGVLHSCSTDIQIQGGNRSIVLKASPTEFYLPEGFPQVLPCRSWTPGDVMCGVQWFHEPSQRVVVSYKLSADTMEADSGYNLSSDFGLLIKSVNHTHGGRYTCNLIDGSGNTLSKGAIDTHVIGYKFPASPYNMSSSATVTRGHRITLPCECAQQSPNASIHVLAVYWSKGEGNSSDTDVIAGRLANGSVLNSQSNANSISSNWSLRVNSPKDSSSFLCHVFRSDDTLSNCYTGVILRDINSGPSSTPVNIYLIIGLSVAVLALLIIGLLFLQWRRGKCPSCLDMTSDTIEPTASKGLKDGASRNQERLEINILYEPPTFLLKVFRKGVMVRERLTSEIELFVSTHKQVIIEGRSGSGKSTCLQKVKCYHEKLNPKLCHRNIVVVDKAVNSRNAISDIRRNLCYCARLCSVLLLIDDCHREDDIVNIMKDIKYLPECRLVMTTRSAKIAEDMSKQYGLHHVTIGGFSSDENVERYLCALHKIAGNEIQTSEHQSLLNFAKQHILPQHVALLPGFWRMLFELHVKTKAVSPHSTLSSLISTKLRYMFDSTGKGLTEHQKRFLADLGKEVLSGMIEGCEHLVELSCETACTDSVNGIEMGLLCYAQESNTNGNESSPLLTGNTTSKVTFSQEIFQELCGGMQVAQNAEEWLEKITVNNWERLANVLVFAGSCLGSKDDKHDVACQILSRLKDINHAIQKGSLRAEIQMQRLAELCLEVNFDGRWEGQLDNEIALLFHEGQLRFWGISCHTLRLLAYSLKYSSKNKYTLKLRSVELFRIDENLSLAEFKQYLDYLYPRALDDNRGIEQVAKEEAVTVRQQKESDDSQKDKSVLDALQSSGLQEIMDTQSGYECHSSVAAADLARYLPDQEHLEKMVLLGSVLGSQQIRDLIHNLYRLKQLKQLDLRLNDHTDDRAFEKIMTDLSACEALTDLRLSLYKVTTDGFENVKDKMEKVATLLKRLQTLYLLHGPLTEAFNKFLTYIIGYMDNLHHFHVSALVRSDEEPGISDEVVEEIRRRKPNLKELVVDYKDVLRAQMQLGKPQFEEGATTSTTSSQNFHVEMGTHM